MRFLVACGEMTDCAWMGRVGVRPGAHVLFRAQAFLISEISRVSDALASPKSMKVFSR